MTLQEAYAAVPAPRFRDDHITLVKLVSLAGNLGMRRSWHDRTDSGPFSYAVFTMNQFGRVRGRPPEPAVVTSSGAPDCRSPSRPARTLRGRGT